MTYTVPPTVKEQKYLKIKEEPTEDINGIAWNEICKIRR